MASSKGGGTLGDCALPEEEEGGKKDDNGGGGGGGGGGQKMTTTVEEVEEEGEAGGVRCLHRPTEEELLCQVGGL